jgi:hypothetical protein
MKRSILFLSIITLFTPLCTLTTANVAISLDASILKVIDGMSIGINGIRIYKIKTLGQKLKNLYQEIGAICAELATGDLNLDSNSVEVQSKLSILKDKLHEITVPFMDDMDGFRPIVLDLIKDSCEKRKNPHSFLLTWGKCPEGKEHESIKNNLKTFSELKTFTSDLILFLGDLIHSCPKGCAQYAELIRQQQEKNQ